MGFGLLACFLSGVILEVPWWWGLSWIYLFMLGVLGAYPLQEGYKLFSGWGWIDTTSFSLVLLSLLLLVLMYIASIKVYNAKGLKFLFSWMMNFLLLFLMGSFLSNNMLYFYFFFEASLIPTLILIVGWGYQPERLQAGVYFMMYTLLVSLPLLLALLYLQGKGLGLLMWDSLNFKYALDLGSMSEMCLSLVLMLAFLVKLPVFMGHLWLPKAHVEAPVAGSMILAGVLLKLGGYGLMRVLGKFTFLFCSLGSFLVSLSLVGMGLIGLVCCRMNDLKALVAYSSVAHMGLVICGIFSGVMWGLSGGLAMMVAHGLSSSGLFSFVNLMYERVGSRSIFMNKGLVSFIPSSALLLFMLCCGNISAPPSINLFSELMLIFGVYYYDSFTMLLFPFGSFLGAVFTFYMFSYVYHGKLHLNLLGALNPGGAEFHCVLLHIYIINLLLLKGGVFLTLI
uniref:NADH-ubiquinone oxidoreductase chain 4 n=1 Tax=Pseudachorutes palmiensis TaxID=187685 RepID=A0A650BKJ0_9HEXA|nr:NADH dehydrogenase subunit 4 [Pseudachorutes palmiensis]